MTTEPTEGANTKYDALLEDHMRHPRHARLLPHVTGDARLEDGDRSITIGLLIADEEIVNAGFHAEGDPVLQGCASFLLTSALGHSMDLARCIRAFALAKLLRLHRDDERVDLTVRVFAEALKAAREKLGLPTRGKWSSGVPAGAPSGRRRKTSLPPPKKQDIELLMAGETYEELMRERTELLGVLLNLDACLSLAFSNHPFRKDETRVLREELICVAIQVKQASSKLSARDRQLIDLLGNQGATEQEAAFQLGVSQPAVNKRLRSIGYHLQKVVRDGTT